MSSKKLNVADAIEKKEKKEFSYENLDIPDEEVPEINEKKGVYKYLPFLQLFMFWMLGLVWRGFRKSLNFKDLPRLTKEYLCTAYLSRFNKYWKNLKGSKLRLFIALYLCYGIEYAISGFLKLFSTILSVISPIFLKRFLMEFSPLVTAEEMQQLEEYRNILPPHLRPPDNYRDMGFRTNSYMIWVWLGVLTVTQVVNYTVMVYSYFLAAKVGTKMRVLLTNRIYDKIFRLSNEGKARKKEILTFLAFDTFIIDEGHHQLHEVWTAIVQVGFSMYFLVDLMGTITLASFAVFVGLIFAMFLLMACILAFRLNLLKHMDLRLDKMKEVLQNSILIKYFNLHAYYLKRIFTIRAKEIKNYRIMYFFRAIISSISYAGPPVCIMLSFVLYYVQTGEFDNIKLLVSISYFKMLQVPLAAISINFTRYIHSIAAMGRVQSFLEESEDQNNAIEAPQDSDVAIEIRNGTFYWPVPSSPSISADKVADKSLDGNEQKDIELKDVVKTGNTVDVESAKAEGTFYLRDINLKIKKGELVMIVGDTRSGKTTLFKSLLGETNRTETTELKISGSFSFCDQEVFLENETVMNNILIGEEYEKAKINEILEVCSLRKDISTFHGGLNLQVGDGSITLSSGQKSRISLARACYYGGDIFLLDNTLGTLDSFVSNHVFQYCLLRYLEKKAVLLITNKCELFPYASQILFMKEGRIFERGTYEELLGKQGGEFSNFVGNHKFKRVMDEKRFNLKKLLKESHDVSFEEKKITVIEKEEQKKGFVAPKTFLSFIAHSVAFFPPPDNSKKWPGLFLGLLSKKWFPGLFSVLLVLLIYLVAIVLYFFSELHSSSIAKNTMYMQVFGKDYHTLYYLDNSSTAVGAEGDFLWCENNYSQSLLANVTGFDEVSEICPHYCNDACVKETVEVFWDSNFKNATVIKNGLGTDVGLVLYAAILLFMFIALLIATYSFFSLYITTSTRLFRKALRKLVNTPMSFFYANPIGRVINRLSHDIVRMDYDLLVRGEFLLTISLLVFGSFAMVIYSSSGLFTPFILIALVVLVCLFSLFRKITIELKRIDSVTKSQVFHHFNQTLNGLSTLSSFNLEEKFQIKCDRYIDVNNRPAFLLIASKFTLRTYLTLLGVFIVFFVGCMAIPMTYYLAPYMKNSESFSTLLQLGITNLNTTVEIFGVVFYNLVVWEIEMNSVERIDFYIRNVKSEPNLLPNADTKTLSVKSGNVEFRNFSLRYKPGFPLVLKQLTFSVTGGDKIVIIGRTGCGKTTILLSIIQILRGCEGGIFVDEQDVSKCDLQSLRNAISTVPADPILFSGTIRTNLDPHGEFRDSDIHATLAKCNIADLVAQHGGIDSLIEENGKNFSIGERRLLSMCRGLLRKPKILLLDECTSIDYRMDEKIQNIVVALENVTVFSISHRLNNLVFFDKVLVMDRGEVQEFDCPKKLVNDEQSFVRKLIDMIPNREEMLDLFGADANNKQNREGGESDVEEQSESEGETAESEEEGESDSGLSGREETEEETGTDSDSESKGVSDSTARTEESDGGSESESESEE